MIQYVGVNSKAQGFVNKALPVIQPDSWVLSKIVYKLAQSILLAFAIFYTKYFNHHADVQRSLPTEKKEIQPEIVITSSDEIDDERKSGIKRAIEECRDTVFPTAANFDVDRLTGGNLNPVFKVETLGKSYVFRFSPDLQTSLSFIDESRMCKLMGERGVSPTIYHVSEAEKAVIMEYMPYETGFDLLAKNESLDKPLRELARVIKRVHNEEIDTFSPTKAEHPQPFSSFHIFKSRLDQHYCPKVFKDALESALQLEEVFQKNYKFTMCHNDFHPGNVLFSPDRTNVRLIDWTFSGSSDPYLDLAKFSKCLENQEEFLSYYLEREPSEEELKHFRLAQAVSKMNDTVDAFKAYLNTRESVLTEEDAEHMDELLISEKEVESEDHWYKESVSRLREFRELYASYHRLGKAL